MYGAARGAVAPNKDKPATAVIHDSDDLRLIVFRIAPGQAVPRSMFRRDVSARGEGCAGEMGDTVVDRLKAGDR